ncbi:hypothetical protein EAH73_01845 [Hymenobacter nivis]|uniref:Uncharacterized protein n=2 Tax=Hymenobacter nivis TaxID=1850093 RepID=A0A502HEW5_9BACT|nr:hypothetical protein EAH73_01845 [Hymenobacter nivis]
MVRPDVFRCESCGTEYYLDNDDINVNYTVRQQGPAAPLPSLLAGKSRAVVVGAVAVGALLLTGALRSLLRPAPVAYYPVAPPYGSVVAGSRDDTDKQAITYTWGSDETILYPGAGGRPERVIIGNRSYRGGTGISRDSLFASFYEAGTGAELRSQPLPQPAGRSTPSFALRRFANGAIYAVLNKATVYQLDPTTHRVADVTQTLFRGQPELASGVASVEFIGENYGDGFTLFTNDGRTLSYYPLIHRVYGKDEVYAAQTGFGSLRPGSPTKTAFTFSTKGLSYPEDKIQLIKYQYRDNGGGPKNAPEFEWEDDYGGSGIFTSADPHRKVLTTPGAMRKARVLSFADFTPGRLYFSPGVQYYDADYVLITFRPTAAENSPLAVQCLNARTAAIVFTLPLPEANGSLDQGLRTSAGFVLGGDHDTYVISPDGRLLHHLDPEKQ